MTHYRPPSLPPSLPPGKHAVPHLVADLPQMVLSNQKPGALSEETVVSVLSTLAEVLGSSVEAAKTLRASQGIERLVLINKDGWVVVGGGSSRPRPASLLLCFSVSLCLGGSPVLAVAR